MRHFQGNAIGLVRNIAYTNMSSYSTHAPFHIYSTKETSMSQGGFVCFFFKLKQQEQAYSSFFLVHTGLCSEIPLESMYISRYKYLPMGLMVNDKNGHCLGFKTLPAAQHHEAHF